MTLAVPLNNVHDVSNLTIDGNNIFGTSSPKEKRFIDSSSFLNSDAHLSPIYEKSSTLSLQNKSMEIEICGRRVVNISHLFQEIKSIDNHKPLDCGFKNMILIGERKLGLKSFFSFKCCMCNIKKTISTENEDLMAINTSAVIGTLNIGCGFSQLQEIMSAMEITTLNHKTYQNEHDRICKGYEIAALKAMENAAKDEAELAIKNGEVDADGIPLITVVADGSWCKRSYRTMYNSPSGMVITII